MKSSAIKLEAFNDCPGATAIKAYLAAQQLQHGVRLVDLDHAQQRFYSNSGDTLVLAIVNASNELRVALNLGEMAVRFLANEFTWQVIDGTYVVRLWWD